jgi:hypothetical protein
MNPEGVQFFHVSEPYAAKDLSNPFRVDDFDG